MVEEGGRVVVALRKVLEVRPVLLLPALAQCTYVCIREIPGQVP